MSEQTVKHRGWVKNAAIIFLSIMLVLTFFSNTILNYSLPEVAAQYAQSGTITTKVRASAPIEANMTFNVEINRMTSNYTMYLDNMGGVITVYSY